MILHRLIVYTLAWIFMSPASLAFERTETRAPCAHFDGNRQALFGDLHVHTRYSFDAYISSVRATPWDAYRYAKGEAIEIPGADGESLLRNRISRPLNFAAVTDHGEYLGQIEVCTGDPGRLGYWWPHCAMTRSTGQWTQLIALDWWSGLSGQKEDEKAYSFACILSDCVSAGKDAWQRIQQAAEDHYDRTEACEFTTFVGYEFTDSPERQNMHRNVIFRNEDVIDAPISTYETGRYNFPELWRGLREQCIDQPGNCDVMSIPHNPNLAGGLMFRDPESEAELNDRLFFEPLVELVQHKGASECRFDRLAGAGLGTEDELCTFEQVPGDNLAMLGTVNGVVRTELAAPKPLEDFARRNMVRNAYKDGLAYGQDKGVNPFVMGVIGSTDTHTALPGGADEEGYAGHLGRREIPSFAMFRITSIPILVAMPWSGRKRTRGTRSSKPCAERKPTPPVVPVRQCVSLAATDCPRICASVQDAIGEAYEAGVPMGGALEESVEPLRFFAAAHKDPGVEGNPGKDPAAYSSHQGVG